MAIGGNDFILTAKKLVDGFGLGRRLNDDDGCHGDGFIFQSLWVIVVRASGWDRDKITGRVRHSERDTL